MPGEIKVNITGLASAAVQNLYKFIKLVIPGEIKVSTTRLAPTRG